MKSALSLLLLFLFVTSETSAGTHTELAWPARPDAGDLPASAQPTVCWGRLDAIIGSIESPTDVDMFEFWILDPMNFSVSTVHSTSNTQLFLFDQAGVGVLSNDDDATGVFESVVTSGDFHGDEGRYFVAISNSGNTPVNGDAAVFPKSQFEVVAPTPDGLLSPVTEWSHTSQTAEFGEYRIELQGASVVFFIEPYFGDVNGDSNVDVSDLDALVEVLASDIPIEVSDVCVQRTLEDVNLDGQVNDDDLTYLLSIAAGSQGFRSPILPGDANLDGLVDRTDLNALALNWQSDVAKWSAGDFTVNGKVDSADLNKIGLNWLQISRAAVPEPSGVPQLILAVAALAIRHRRDT